MIRQANAYRIAIQLSETPVWSGSGWLVICPAHDDTTPSLHLTETDDGTVLFFCHARCHYADIRQAMRHLGVDPANPATGNDARPRPNSAPVPAPRPINAGPFSASLTARFLHPALGIPTAIWPYPWFYDPRLSIQVIARYETPQGKTYRPWQMVHSDHGSLPRLLCARLPDPQPLYHDHAIPNASTVLFVEGEKTADATRLLLAQYPFIAVTTTPGGTGRAHQASLNLLPHRNIVLAYDDDDSGRQANRRLADHVTAHGLPAPATLALRHDLPNPTGQQRPPAWDPGDEGHGLTPDIIAEWTATLPPDHPLCPAAASQPPP